MNILISIDSFKGSMTSMQAGNAAKKGILKAVPDAEAVVCPLADGGEGTTDALIEGMSGEKIELEVTGPLGETVSCYYGWLEESRTAVMEMASAAGLTLVNEKNPMMATTYGVGEMILDAAKSNSTVVDQDNEPWASWGQMIPHFFGTDVCIANYAESGESANTFIAAGRLKKALSQIKKGDYLFMEFGHNDQKQKGPGKGAYYSFMTSLKTFIDEARARGAYPVLVTPTQRRSFDATGHIRDTHEDYPEAMRWLAAKENVPLIDLNEMTRTLYEALGTETSKRAFVHYPAGTYPGQTKAFEDNTHFNPYGAYQIAQCVIEGMKKAVPELAKYLKIDPSYNPAQPDDVNSFHWNESPFTEIEKPDGN